MIQKLLEINIHKNTHYVKRYIKFIEHLKVRVLNDDEIVHKHHILPKAKDMFPEYKNFLLNPWNCVLLTPREHFIAHMILCKAFSGSSQTLAFFNMTRKFSIKSSKMYDVIKNDFIHVMKDINKEKSRCEKISCSLKGKPKSEEHIKKLIGHYVSDTTREKLRMANLGKKHTLESKQKMSNSRIGKKRTPHTEETKNKCRERKLSQNMKWYNNGTEEKILQFPIDNTWILGRLTGGKFYNNGEINKIFFTPPDSSIWVKGKISTPPQM